MIEPQCRDMREVRKLLRSMEPRPNRAFVSVFRPHTSLSRFRLLTCYYSMEGAHDPRDLCKYNYDHQAMGEWASGHTSNPNPWNKQNKNWKDFFGIPSQYKPIESKAMKSSILRIEYLAYLYIFVEPCMFWEDFDVDKMTANGNSTLLTVSCLEITFPTFFFLEHFFFSFSFWYYLLISFRDPRPPYQNQLPWWHIKQFLIGSCATKTIAQLTQSFWSHI